MTAKPNRRTKVTRSLLQNALMELMQEKAFSRITVKELCEQADLNRTTFYLHYPNQEALLADVEEQANRRTVAFIQKIRTGGDRIHYTTLLLEHIKENECIYRVLLTNNPNGTFRDTFLDRVEENIQDNIPEAGTPVQSNYIHFFIVSGCVNVIGKWIDGGFEQPTEEMADLICRMAEGVYLPFSPAAQ